MYINTLIRLKFPQAPVLGFKLQALGFKLQALSFGL